MRQKEQRKVKARKTESWRRIGGTSLQSLLWFLALLLRPNVGKWPFMRVGLFFIASHPFFSTNTCDFSLALAAFEQNTLLLQFPLFTLALFLSCDRAYSLTSNFRTFWAVWCLWQAQSCVQCSCWKKILGILRNWAQFFFPSLFSFSDLAP